jgi:glycosyltransferase involved in cell wall biosynthesis
MTKLQVTPPAVPSQTLKVVSQEHSDMNSWSTWARTATSLWTLRIREWVTYDSRLVHLVVGALAWPVLRVLLVINPIVAFRFLFSLHRSNVSRSCSALAERVVSQANQSPESPIFFYLKERVSTLQPDAGTQRYFDDPRRLLGSRVLVTKSPRGSEKGLVCVDYNYIFPVFARLFDIPQIATRYHLLLEPSWSGYCDPDILSYLQYDFPIFVQAYEPRDLNFVRDYTKFTPIPVSANWWVDDRIFRPLPTVEKDIDLVMVAGWASYKRHFRVFEALGRLRRQGHRLSVMLIGYPLSWTKETVLRHARYFGISDQLEIHERLPYEQVNAAVNRARVHVLWARKEGVNRAIIECMFAGVPTIVRQGFNYGYSYPYINDQTGCFSTEQSLPRDLLALIERSPEMNPRRWVLENMSAARATEVVSETIGKWSAEYGEPWTESPVVMCAGLNGKSYWDAADAERFAPDYEWLLSAKNAAT